jgi:Relaxase/Mobilisation nuclease domain
VIIKGASRAGGADLGAHLNRTDTNESVQLLELRGVAGVNLDQALREMEAFGAGTRCKSPLYHANIDPRADEVLTAAQWQQAVDALEAKLGLTDQPRAVVQHIKQGRAHVHVVWSRIDLEKNRAVSDSHNYRKHEEVARALERAFGHERVQGAHVERDGRARPARTPSHAEMQQAERTGRDPKAIKAEITSLWRQTDSGRAFTGALAEAGYVLARGDKRDFIVIDQAGESHSLARRIEGAKAAEIRERMADVDQARLPGASEARRQAIEAEQAREEAREAAEQRQAALAAQQAATAERALARFRAGVAEAARRGDGWEIAKTRGQLAKALEIHAAGKPPTHHIDAILKAGDEAGFTWVREQSAAREEARKAPPASRWEPTLEERARAMSPAELRTEIARLTPAAADTRQGWADLSRELGESAKTIAQVQRGLSRDRQARDAMQRDYVQWCESHPIRTALHAWGVWKSSEIDTRRAKGLEKVAQVEAREKALSDLKNAHEALETRTQTTWALAQVDYAAELAPVAEQLKTLGAVLNEKQREEIAQRLAHEREQERDRGMTL